MNGIKSEFYVKKKVYILHTHKKMTKNFCKKIKKSKFCDFTTNNDLYIVTVKINSNIWDIKL